MEKERLLTLYSDVYTESLRWIWEPYIPQGKITLLQAGSAETITSFLTSLISEISKGGETPDGKQIGRPYTIIYQSSIDKTLIRESLENQGAYCNHISFMDCVEPELLEDNLDELGKAMEDIRPDIAVIDTVGAYSAEALRTGLVALPHRKTMVRLNKLANEFQCTVIFTGLLKIKRKTKSDFERSYFDMDVLSMARSILQIEQREKEHNTYALRQIKNNLAPEGKDIKFSILPSGEVRWLCGRTEAEKKCVERRNPVNCPGEIDGLPLPGRVIRNLKRADKDTFEKILAIEDKAAFLRIRNIGEKGYMQVIEALEARGLDVTHLK